MFFVIPFLLGAVRRPWAIQKSFQVVGTQCTSGSFYELCYIK